MEAEVRAHTFQPRDLVGGDVVLNLVNTVTARNAEPVDWLDGYARLLDWAELAGAFPAADLAHLRSETVAHPRTAARALTRVQELRETIWELLTAIARASLRPLDEHIATVLPVEASGLDYLTHALALHAVRLLGDVSLSRLRVCAGRQC